MTKPWYAVAWALLVGAGLAFLMAAPIGDYSAGWAILGAIGIALEVAALAKHRGKGNTLSEHVWELLERPWFRVAFGTAWIWLTWHFFVEYFWVAELRETLIDDAIGTTAVALAIAAWTMVRDR